MTNAITFPWPFEWAHPAEPRPWYMALPDGSTWCGFLGTWPCGCRTFQDGSLTRPNRILLAHCRDWRCASEHPGIFRCVRVQGGEHTQIVLMDCFNFVGQAIVDSGLPYIMGREDTSTAYVPSKLVMPAFASIAERNQPDTLHDGSTVGAGAVLARAAWDADFNLAATEVYIQNIQAGRAPIAGIGALLRGRERCR